MHSQMLKSFFFNLKSKAQTCLTSIEYNYFDYNVYSKNVDLLNSLNSFYQNISGL
jgi:hypothetical protein